VLFEVIDIFFWQLENETHAFIYPSKTRSRDSSCPPVFVLTRPRAPTSGTSTQA
jgi:hypothetical protein